MGKYRSIATENELIIHDGGYTAPGGARVELAGLVADAAARTRSYTVSQTAHILRDEAYGSDRPALPTVFEVTAETSSQAAFRLVRRESAAGVAVQNFASARNPGGGYLGGARAQEEDLCRSSALYTTLCEAPDYYAAHRASTDLRYSHRVIFSPDVPVYRDHRLALLDEPFLVSFVTAAAPNGGQLRRREAASSEELAEIVEERAARVLAVALHHAVRTVVLGAWGCGVFGNDPDDVAAAFRRHLLDGGLFQGAFERVVFAVPDHGAGLRNHEVFRAVFADAATRAGASAGHTATDATATATATRTP